MSQRETDLLDLIGYDHLANLSDWPRFVAALLAVALGHGGWISLNDMRATLTTPAGFQIEPRRYSTFYRRAQLAGLIRHDRDDLVFYDRNDDASGHNSGKWQRRYRATRALYWLNGTGQAGRPCPK